MDPFSIKNRPSVTVPAMMVSAAMPREVTASPTLIGVSHTEDATSNRSMVSEEYPAV